MDAEQKAREVVAAWKAIQHAGPSWEFPALVAAVAQAIREARAEVLCPACIQLVLDGECVVCGGDVKLRARAAKETP